MHFTEFGIRHVVLLIVLALVIYAWLITKHNFNQEQVDKKIRQNLPWLILLCFAVEGIFGMPIAIYIDVRLKLALISYFTWVFFSVFIFTNISSVKCFLTLFWVEK